MLKLLHYEGSDGAARRVRPAQADLRHLRRRHPDGQSKCRSPAQESLGLMDMAVERNAYGRQVDSRVVELDPDRRIPGAHRAGQTGGRFHPRSHHPARGRERKVLARYNGDPVLVEEGKYLVATFHPELTPDSRVHRYFLEKL